MIVPRERLDRYSRELNALADEAERVAMAAYDAMRKADPNASIADIREGIKAIVEAVTASYGQAAGELSCELYDELAEASGASVPQADLGDVDDDTIEAIDSSARYIVGAFASDGGE